MFKVNLYFNFIENIYIYIKYFRILGIRIGLGNKNVYYFCIRYKFVFYNYIRWFIFVRKFNFRGFKVLVICEYLRYLYIDIKNYCLKFRFMRIF